MRAVIQPFLPFNIPRVAQLIQRSNQFNLRTVRYTEKQVMDLAGSAAHVTMAFELKDRFGDSGLISVIILEIQDHAFFVDTWLMSCRVLGRGMEQFVLNNMVKKAGELGLKHIRGEYVATSKNGMVKDHYAKLGFEPEGACRWVLAVDRYIEHPVNIVLDQVEEVASARES